MSIKVDYKLKGMIEIKDSIIRVDRLWGSSKEGWTALVGVYIKTLKDIPAVDEVTEQRLVTEAAEEAEAVYETVVVTEAVEASQVEVLEKIDEFNHSAAYVDGERGYESLYLSLQDKFGGEEC